MKTLDQLSEEIVDKIKQLDVTDAEYEAWKTNKVTRRFLLEAQLAMIIALDDADYDGPPSKVEEVALQSAYVKGVKETTEYVIEWTPFQD